MSTLSVSPGNIKLGAIRSVSLPAGITCGRECENCYAKKLEKLRPSVRKAYQNNLKILNEDRDEYWRQVNEVLKTSRYFRFHVSGDIPNPDYLLRMAHAALENPKCEILCFTKRYEFVSDFLDAGNFIPQNLHLILSGWKGLKMHNPYDLPEAHVIYRDGTTTARAGAKECEGNCSRCASTEGGCWTLKNGEQVVFHEH